MFRKSLPVRKRISFIYRTFGAPYTTLEMLDRELPPRARGTLRVNVSHAPVNPSDLIPITGSYAHRISLPAVAGYEGVGRVVEAPEALSHMVGRRVLPLRGEGTWQTYVDCPAHHAVEVPDRIPDIVAARAYINPMAAATMLRLWPARGKVVLLSGAGSSCAEHLGRWAIAHGATRVMGVYRSESRKDRLRQVGIEPIPIHDLGTISKASALADIAFDSLGGDIGTLVLEGMRGEANFVAYGLLTGKPVTTGAGVRARYHRFHMRDHFTVLAGLGMQAAFSDIWPLLEGAPPAEPRVFPAQQWQDALAEAERPGGQKPILDFSSLN
ncbi:zinc-dependent alcohol dehydrogenase family protein [Salipiger bermudensis]|uniref:zinc-dependent alcohol dehydrogenase family protein n=1 Tax=Salipiger bermudensis TaxID=344736 RepID=UPI001CD66D2E|nr:zinc-dependent alcohol dehydrogenase family protein [Salipiger bermudensis]MCA0964605.1 zinc-dependent alcohol dehydrogenase family protein [Salipiger bermudensis]